MPKVNFTVQLIDVKMGKNNYWLDFTAYADSMDKNRKYKIEFCGTEMITNISLNDTREETLKQSLKNDYGYGPYELPVITEKLKIHNHYYL